MKSLIYKITGSFIHYSDGKTDDFRLSFFDKNVFDIPLMKLEVPERLETFQPYEEDDKLKGIVFSKSLIIIVLVFVY